MMKRKVVKHGTSTLTVSLPSKWAKKYGVKNGDEVEVTEEGRKLGISTSSTLREKSITLSLDGPERFLIRVVGYLYKKGYDIIEIISENQEVISFVSKIAGEKYLGFEVIEQTEKRCLIRNIAIGIETEFDSILRKIILGMISMAESSFDAIKKKEYSRLNEIKLAELSNNKMTNFCERVLVDKGYGSEIKTMFMYSFVRELEKIADEYKYICEYYADKKNIRISKQLIDFYSEVNDFLKLVYEIFNKFTMKRLESLSMDKNRIKNKYHALVKDINKEEIVLIHHLVNIYNQVQEIGGVYFGAVYEEKRIS